MKKLSLLAASIMAMSMHTSAATINVTQAISDDVLTYSLDNTSLFTGPDAFVSCAVDACAFLGAADLSNSGMMTELDFLNSLIDDDFESDTGFFKDEDPSESFSVTEKYFLLKFGSSISVWFENLLSPSAINITVETDRGAGLSHVTTSPSEVPVPGTLSLLGLGLIGLGALRKKVS